MKILLVAPSSGYWKGIAKKRFFNGKTFRFSMLPLLTLAGLTPKEHEVTIVDEQIDALPVKKKFDLVAITAMTALAPRAYDIAHFFRLSGIPVVMGGFHATLNPEDALKHVDSIVIGPAYGAWRQLLEDLQAGSLKRMYYGKTGNGCIPVKLPREMLQAGKYVSVNATFATLGCSNGCLFCSVNKFYGMKRHERRVDEVISEIGSFKEKFFIFIDDNLVQDRIYATKLFTALVPLKKKWTAQVSIDISDDEELLDLMGKAGCIGVFIGLETFSEQALMSQDKNMKSPAYYRDSIKKIHKRGIFIESGIILGFDSDDRKVFKNTLRMLHKTAVDLIQLSILTPLPGTGLYSEMKCRITDHDLEHYDFRHAVFDPKLMTAEELQDGADWVIRQFYSPHRIIGRIFRWLFMKHGIVNLVYPAALSLAYLGRVIRFNINGSDPDIKKVTSYGRMKNRNTGFDYA
jgi:radical SAM superfamily enzyme YgiQ (UPF0313 family)